MNDEPTETGGRDREESDIFVDHMPDREIIRLRPTFGEQAAKDIADKIVLIFGITTATAIGGGLLVIWQLGVLKGSAQDAALVAKDAIGPLLGTVGTFASTVFGPLLAFVLGYYFGTKSTPSSKVKG